MKKRLLIAIFLLKRFGLCFKLFFRKSKSKRFKIQLDRLEIPSHEGRFSNHITIEFQQLGAVGILVNNIALPLFDQNGAIRIPRKLFEGSEMEISIFSFFQIKTYSFQLNSAHQVYPVRSTLRKRKWKHPSKLENRVDFRPLKHIGTVEAPRISLHLFEPRLTIPKFSIAHPQLKLNLNQLKSELKSH